MKKNLSPFHSFFSFFLSLSLTSSLPLCPPFSPSMPPSPPPKAGLLASRLFERRFELGLLAFFGSWGLYLAGKKFSNDTPEELRHDPFYEVHHPPTKEPMRESKEEGDGDKAPASVRLSKAAGMMVDSDSDDPIARASGGNPLVVGVFPNAAITKSRIGDATPAGRRAAAKEAERAKK